MKKYSILTQVIQLPTQSEIISKQFVPISVDLPDNAIPLQVDYHHPVGNIPASCSLHYLVPVSIEGLPLCEICNKKLAVFEGTMCLECKEKQDASDLLEERKAMAEDWITIDHKGEQCFIGESVVTCQVGLCENCQVFLDWKKKYGI